MRYFQLIDQATNESIYVEQEEVPIVDETTRIFESFDEKETYIEITE